MKHLCVIFLAVLVIITNQAFSQTPPTLSGNTSSNGIFDTITGVSSAGTTDIYLLQDLNINKKIPDGLGNSILSSTLLCSAGYFEIYGEAGCGFEPTTTPSLVAVHAQRQAVLCQVFTDISNFITNKGGITNKVRVLIKNSGTIASAATSLQLGRGTAYFITPASSTGTLAGITDCTSWLTINTGQDAFYNLIGGYGGQYFHGDLAFNFLNTTSIFWNSSLTTAPVTGEVDLYTVILHEANHILGFMSLVDFNGLSRLTVHPYFNRYDKFLTTPTGISLIAPTTTCAALSYSWNITAIPNPKNILSPGNTPSLALCPPSVEVSNQSNVTTCSTSIKFAGTNTVSVYTQDCFVKDGSLSHFEDMCTPGPIGNNDLYFNMSNSSVTTGSLAARRFYQEEERSAMCDIGYAIGSSFGASGNLQHTKTYTASPCPGISVAGVNDGVLPNGLFAYTSNVGSPSASIFPLLNDLGSPTAMGCLQLIYGAGAISTTSTSFVFTPATQGVHVFRYVPVSASGEQGNITYVSFFALSTSCTSTCNIISNGGFESSVGCGVNQTTITYTNDCWTPGLATPDFYKRFCSAVPGYGIPALSVNTWDFPAAGNNSFYGLANMDGYNESIQGQLSTTLNPGSTYVFQGWFHTLPWLTGSPVKPLTLDLTASTGPYAPGATNTSAYPSGVITLTTLTVPTTNIWTYLSSTFTYTGSSPATFVQLRMPYTGNVPTGSTDGYVAMIDDLSLMTASTAVTFTPPLNVCLGSNVTNLASYATPTTSGTYSISGPGVVFSGGIYTFSSSVTGIGTYNVLYTYTNTTGCTYTAAAQFNVIQPLAGNMTVGSYPTWTICPNTTFTADVAVTGVSTPSLLSNYSFTWMPGSSTGITFTATPASNTVYTVTGQDNFGCGAPVSITFTVLASLPTVTLSPLTQTICAGQNATITISGQASQGFFWNPNPFIQTNTMAVDNPTATTTYTCFATHATGTCSGTATTTIVVQNCFCNASNTITPAALTSSVYSGGTSYAINQNITITGGSLVQFVASEFRIAPGMSITVAPTATLIIDRGHLLACNDMWSGIIVQPGGKLITKSEAFIEDAVIAVNVTNHTATTYTILDIQQTIFNKNFAAISVSDYVQPVTQYPFIIRNCVFTSRDIPFSGTSWPTVAALKATCTTTSNLQSPYCLQNWPTQGLKAPNAGTFGRVGVRLTNVGLTINPTTSPTYYSFQVGDYTGTTGQYLNIFDNLFFGIQAGDANLKSYQNIFQNSQSSFSVSSVGGMGIVATTGRSQPNTYITLFAPAPFSMTRKNKFYDCTYALQGTNIFELNAQRCEIYSTQTATTSYQRGKYGFYLTTNRFRQYDVANNSIYNVENAITFNSTYGRILFSPNTYTNAQYAGQVNLNFNKIKPTPSGPITSQFVSNAITMQNILSAGGSQSVIAGTNLQSSGNDIDQSYRGIYATNFNLTRLQSANNIIGLRNDPTNIIQYGINHNSCTSNSITTNSITGTGTTNTFVTAIYTSLNNTVSVLCNSVSSTFQGFEFSNSQPGTQWKGNNMINHGRGFVLTNTAVIGPQGSSGNPIDNAWNNPTAWVGPNFRHTYTSFSTASLSILWVKNSAVLTPTNNDGNPSLQSYAVGAVSVTTGSYVCGNINPNPAVAIMVNIVNDPTNFIGRNHVYRSIKQDPSIISGDPTLQNFYTTNQTQCFGKLSKIEDDLADGNLTGANSQITGFSPSNSIETNYKDFYSIYSKCVDSTYNGVDSLALFNIAAKCPFVDGAIVYQARALFNARHNAVVVFNDNCPVEDEENSRLMQQNGFENTPNNWTVNIFPNPANDILYITTNKEIEEIQLFITDVSGKIVSDFNLKTTSFGGQIKLDLAEGIYFISINNQNDERIIKKLVIQK